MSDERAGEVLRGHGIRPAASEAGVLDALAAAMRAKVEVLARAAGEVDDLGSWFASPAERAEAGR